jgi:hypothetical protein
MLGTRDCIYTSISMIVHITRTVYIVQEKTLIAVAAAKRGGMLSYELLLCLFFLLLLTSLYSFFPSFLITSDK